VIAPAGADGKVCPGPVCLGQVRPLTAFNRCTRDGFQSWCRECRSAGRRVQDAANQAVLFGHYGTVCACPGCGATEDLTIDHVNGGGRAHRKRLRRYGSGFWRWLIAEGFPDGYQTLCAPCNVSKAGGPACRIDHAAPPGWKRCTGPCGRTLPSDAFHRNRRKTDGRDPTCRECANRRPR
jgi:hypothetical protein